MNTSPHMADEVPDLSYLTEQDWLAHWAAIPADLEQLPAEHARAGVRLGDGPAGLLAGRAELLRVVLASRGAAPGT